MALIEVKVPQLSESVAEATLLHWHKKPGDAVARDENLIDIETGQIIEFHNAAIEDLQRKIAAELGYDLVDHRLELYGARRKRHSSQ